METVKRGMLMQTDILEKTEKAYKNYKKSPKERITPGYLKSRLEVLEVNFNEFKTNHSEIIVVLPKEERQNLTYFSEDMWTQFEELYYSYKGDLISSLQLLTPENSFQVQAKWDESKRDDKGISEEIQLPRIQLRTFGGDYTQWQSFHDMFLALVHKNGKLDNVQKLHYLKSSLTGDAEVLLRPFSITGENYVEAWSILKKRYSNKRYIANCVFKKFFGQKSLLQESASGLRQLTDTSVECISALKNLGLPTAQWDSIVNFVVVSKLDSATHKQWEESISGDESDDLPNFERLKLFLETRFRMLEMVADKSKQTGARPRACYAVTAGDPQCVFCKGAHYIYHCKLFAKEPLENRYNIVEKSKLCFNCLVPNHTVFKCRIKTSCQICKRKHHSLLHRDYKKSGEETRATEEVANDNQENTQVKVTAHMASEQSASQCILLATALVDVTASSGQTHVLRALIDQGSEASFITARIVDLLGMKKTNISGEVSGVGEGRVSIKNMVDIQIKSRYDVHFTINVNAYVLKSITRRLPAREIKGYNWSQFKNLKLADPSFNVPGRIDILLGADVFGKIIDSGFIRGPGNVVAQYTHLGWILSGDTNLTSVSQHCITSLHTTTQIREDNELLRKFWELETESYTNKKLWNQEEIQCEEIYKNTTTRDESGRYVVQLPLKKGIEETVKLCGNTKNQAIWRLNQLEKRFTKNSKLKEEYTKVIQEYMTLGHMKRAEDEDTPETIYLAHHAVIRDDKDTSKVRVVFDASAKGSNGCSLNSSMMVGPTIQPDLRDLIIRWRSHKICVVGDIIKMYRQVKMTDKHTDLQRIVWRNDTTKEVESFKLLTVTFGTAAAPFLAVRTLKQLADDEAVKYPRGAAAIANSFFMDDMMEGHENLSEIKCICNEVDKILKAGGFQMQKWSSNSEELLEFLKKGTLNTKPVKETMEIKWDKVIKILGLTWDRKDDNFKITVSLPEVRRPLTKRIILSDVASLFDPFGWLSPVIITAKIMIQKLWLCSLGWDDELPPDLVDEWIRYREELQDLHTIEIPRWIRTTSHCKEVQLHGFSDASSLAMAAVVYLRVVSHDDEVHVTLIASKTKVAPLKQLTIPRLELCAAVLLAKLLHDISSILNVPMERIYAWTDSMVVLSWLQSQPSRWQVFVGNRVSDIIQHIDNERWRHVISSDNPADLGSRGIRTTDLTNSNLWWSGPQWLSKKNIDYIRSSIPETELEIKRSFHINLDDTPIWERFSSMSRMKRVLTYCKRFISKGINKKREETLSVSELNDIEERCIKYYQRLKFGEEIEDLKKRGKIKKKSTLISLTPYLDKKGLLRVGGRLQNADMPEDAKNPIIIPNKQHVTNLLINEAHTRTLHGGIRQMMTYIRSKYWIISLKSAVRHFIRRCTVCIRDKAVISQQLMGQLPAPRVTPQRAFFNSGVDFAGPVSLRTSKGRGHKSTKGYICLFICMCTKAIHLEAVTDLTSQAFIAAFRRFVARRGHCAHLWSDNGTNFVGADKLLKDMFHKSKNNLLSKIAELLANDGTTWHFIPPRAPNFGGVWEAGVRSAKKHLSRVNSTTKLTYEEMSTLLAQVEACLNSRPICQLDETIDTLNPLTPGHFLIGEPLINIPDENYENKNVNLLTRWQLIQNRVQDFWKRWKSEYLNTLQQRYKWQDIVPSPRIGDIVIVKEEDLPPAKWLLGKITTLHPGPDQLLRVVSVQCKGNNIIKRPLSKLILLPKKPNESY